MACAENEAKQLAELEFVDGAIRRAGVDAVNNDKV
jgi:hypothetical protein